MAGDTELNGNPDLTSHVRTYDGLITLLKWGAVTAVVIAGLVIWLISSR